MGCYDRLLYPLKCNNVINSHQSLCALEDEGDCGVDEDDYSPTEASDAELCPPLEHRNMLMTNKTYYILISIKMNIYILFHNNLQT